MTGIVTKGNPVIVTYKDSNAIIRTEKVFGVELLDGYPSMATTLFSAGGIPFTEQSPYIDGINGATIRALSTSSFPYTYNPTTNVWNRFRGNHSASLLVSAARTATTNSTDQTNYNSKGVHVVVNVTAYPAAASVTPYVQGYDDVSATYYDILIGLPIVATGYTVLKIYPGIGEIANAAASDILPNTWRVNMVHANADSITYSVGAQLVT